MYACNRRLIRRLQASKPRLRLHSPKVALASPLRLPFLSDARLALRRADGTVICSSACTALVWNQHELREYLSSVPEMQRAVHHVLVASLVKGLLKQREATVVREPECTA